MQIINLARLNRAFSTVIEELHFWKFYDEKLSKVEIYLVPFGLPHGWQNYGSNHDICIPAVSMSRLAKLLGFQACGLTDVLRHEFAHALADTHRGLFHSSVFTDAFGDTHSSKIEYEYDPFYFVSSYAAKNTSECYADVFMFFVKYKGILPARFDTLPIRRQWQFIKRLSSAIKQGKSRW